MDNNIKQFKDVFPTLTLNDKLSRIADFLSVFKVCLNKEKRLLTIYVSSHQWIHKAHLHKLERLIAGQLFNGMNMQVRIDERFELSRQYTPQTFFENYKNSMKYELQEKSPVLAHIFDAAKFEISDLEIVISINNHGLFTDADKTLAEFVERVFRERALFDMHCRIESLKEKKSPSAVYDDIPRPVIKESRAESEMDKKKPDSFKEKSAGEREEKAEHKKRASDNPDIIFGNDIKEDAILISEVDESSGNVVLNGEIIFTDARELRNGKVLFMFNITDYTDSICVKMFLEPDKHEELAPLLKKGSCIKVKGRAALDTYMNEISVTFVNSIKKIAPFKEVRKDDCDMKRIELHCHSKMSDMDGVADAAALVKRAYEWGHPAIAITDHGVVQAFPEANHAMEDIDRKYRSNYAKEHPELSNDELKKISAPFKVIYGCEIYIVDDTKKPVKNPKGQSLDDSFVVFDLETTGFSPESSKIIEIGAVKVCGGKIVGRFSTFVNPKIPIPLRIEQLTGINDSMVMDYRTIDMILPEFLEFCEDSVLVAHNADFDYSFIKKNAADLGSDYEKTVVDTVSLSRFLIPRLSRFKLDTVAKHLCVYLGSHHRAVDDAEATAGIFIKLCEMLSEKDITDLDMLNEKGILAVDAIRHLHSNHAVVLVKNEVGRVNLYRLISESHLKYFYRHPIVPKSVFEKYREGLILGTACASGELYSAIVRGSSGQEISSIVEFYDYLEIQPVGNSSFLIKDERTESVVCEDDLRKINKKIIALGEEFNKPVVATGDVHFLDPDDEIYRRIIMCGQGFSDADEQAPLYLHTTKEMLEEFSYLSEEKRNEVVIKNPQLIADMCEKISPIRKGKFPPVIENSDRDLRKICYKEAERIYGKKLRNVVTERLE